MTSIISKDATVIFTPSGMRGKFAVGTPLLQAARKIGVDIDSLCGGRGICGRCQVSQTIGDFPKYNIKSSFENLSPFGSKEEDYKQRRGLKPDRRLSCSCVVNGDMVIDVPEESQLHKQVIRKSAEDRDIEIDPIISLYYIEVDKPDMHKPSGDTQRVIKAIKEQWNIDIDKISINLISKIQKILRKDDFKITVAVRLNHEIIAIWSGFNDQSYGLAIDVGSTTISMHLTNLTNGKVVNSVGSMNPQIRFGEDLMSRVSYAMMNEGGDMEMTNAVRRKLNEMVAQVAGEANIDCDNILEMVLVGNPVMHHLILGINPVELGWAPFALATNDSVTILAKDIGISLNQDIYAYFLPCIAGHVGADASAVILSTTPQYHDELTLVVDIGTNAEIIFGNKDRLLACSSPTGPALEGAQISSGQRAAVGAIERIRINKDTLEPKFAIIGCDKWSDEEGFYEIAKKTGISGICGSGIIEAVAEMFLSGIINADGVVNGKLTEKSNRIVKNGRVFDYILHFGTGLDAGTVEIRITQADIRAIQLAKGALWAGAQLLIERMGKPVERIILAGAFGSHIDVKYAMILGLIPDCPLDMVTSAGNAAGTGALIALLNKSLRAEIECLVPRIEKIETAIESKFQEHFIGAMAIPHKVAKYENLAKIVELPTAKNMDDDENSDDTGIRADGRRSRRRRKHNK